MDLAGGTLLLLVAVPVLLAFALVLAVDLRCWPLFLQDRIGHDGRVMRFPKLRTLRPETPRYQLKHEADWQLSPFRAWLRTSHLDELPQLWLVVTGQMSLVGPRPRMPERFEPVDPEYAVMREQVRQGCTGLWQISVHAGLLPSETPAYDHFYVHYATVRMDLWILLRTGLLMLGLGRSVRLDEVPGWCLRGARPVLDREVLHLPELQVVE